MHHFGHQLIALVAQRELVDGLRRAWRRAGVALLLAAHLIRQSRRAKASE
jgi:hypothetical protein